MTECAHVILCDSNIGPSADADTKADTGPRTGADADSAPIAGFARFEVTA